jgi:hypothetical protein
VSAVWGCGFWVLVVRYPLEVSRGAGCGYKCMSGPTGSGPPILDLTVPEFRLGFKTRVYSFRFQQV